MCMIIGLLFSHQSQYEWIFLWIQHLFHFRCDKNLHEEFSLLSTLGLDPSESIKSYYNIKTNILIRDVFAG